MTAPPLDTRAVKKDFPLLDQQVHDKPIVFLDSAASSQKPRIVLFLNGLNDFTQNIEVPFEDRLPAYLEHMRRARDLARLEEITQVFALQPFLTGKRHKSRIEDLILQESPGGGPIGGELPRLRRGLEEIASEETTYFADCSGAFDSEIPTTFSDLWHFSDPGHELLAACLEASLDRILAQLAAQSSGAG